MSQSFAPTLSCNKTMDFHVRCTKALKHKTNVRVNIGRGEEIAKTMMIQKKGGSAARVIITVERGDEVTIKTKSSKHFLVK